MIALESQTRRRIAIIGAGMAGAAAARRLSLSGHRVALFDKGRGIGGRMATRRLPRGRSFDHGAHYVTARDPGFAAAVRGLADSGCAAPWGKPGWSVGTPSMTSGLPPRGCPSRAIAASRR